MRWQSVGGARAGLDRTAPSLALTRGPRWPPVLPMSSYPPRSGVDAYRASPVQHRHNGGGLSGGGGGGGRAAAASWRNADSGDQGKAQHGVEVYGLEHAGAAGQCV